MKKVLFILIILMVTGIQAKAQKRDTSEFFMGTVIGNDTIIHKDLKEVWVYPNKKFRNKRQEANFWRYVNKVRKVYPYAKRANELLKQYEPQYLNLKTQRERRRLIKRVEDDLMAQYKSEFKKMTISEGKILIKLIDRETQRTSFELIKEFRGGVTAFFWQSIARIFGNDLKAEFDPYGEDHLIEEIVTLIEAGYFEGGK